MGPLSLEAWSDVDGPTRELLSRAAHVSVSAGVGDTLFDLVSAADRRNHMFDGRLPSNLVILEPENGTLLFWLGEYDAMKGLGLDFAGGIEDQDFLRGKVLCGVVTQGRARLHGVFQPKTPQMWFFCADEHVDTLASLMLQADLLFTLMAEPRLVIAGAPPRAERRRAARVLGRNTPTVWSRISWTVGDHTKAKSQAGDDQHRRALHYCKAHWRRTHEGAPKAEVRPGHGGVWAWVEGCFRGHPDYGVKLSRYVPKVEPGGKSANVLAAMQGAQKSMIARWKGAN